MSSYRSSTQINESSSINTNNNIYNHLNKVFKSKFLTSSICEYLTFREIIMFSRMNKATKNTLMSNKAIVNLCKKNLTDDDLPKQLRKYENIGTLNLSNNRLKGMNNVFQSPSLSTLENLDLSFNYIENISDLSKLNIKRLNLSTTLISSITQFINGFTNLEILNLSQNEIISIDCLTNLKNLNELILIDNKIDQIPNFHDCIKLQYVNLSWNLIKDISPLKEITYLTKLNLFKNSISEIYKFKEGFEFLEDLNLGCNNISDLSPITYLSRLKKFYIAGNTFTSINSISCCNNRIEELCLAKNRFDFTDIKNFILLKKLDLSDTRLRNISIFEGNAFIFLEDLILRYNDIEDYTPLGNLPNLKKLDLACCKLKNITFFDKGRFSHLEEVNLSGNGDINNYLPISRLRYSIKKLNLSSNNIQNLDIFDGNGDYIEMKVLDLRRNNIGKMNKISLRMKLGRSVEIIY